MMVQIDSEILEHMERSMSFLIDNIDSGVSTKIFKETEQEKPEFSTLRYARQTLKCFKDRKVVNV